MINRIKHLRRIPKLPIRSVSYNYNYNYQYQPPNYKRRVVFGIGLVSITYGLYYLYWPKHTFPSPVAKILRKGLWAESDKGENDYQLALKHYIEALEKCDELQMDHLDDEYTGIQLKIGEMFERLGMKEDANFIYNEIATLYLKTLTDESRRLSPELRCHLIQKDLRIVIKLVELHKSNLNLSKAILFTHSVIATKEIEDKLGVNLNSLIVDENGKFMPRFQFSIEFIDEYINLMNLLIAINIELGDYSLSTDLNVKLNKLMLLSNIEPKKILMSQCNLGSLLYLQSEEFEYELISILKENNLDKSLPYDKVLEKADAEFKSFDNFKVSYNNLKKCIDLAIDAYENVLKISNNLVGNKMLPSNTVNTSSTINDELYEINEIIALATYSLGVINLHLRQYDKAERLLRESRVKCKQCDYDELINEIELELNKLFKERNKSK